MEAELRGAGGGHAAGHRPAYADLQHRFDALDGYTLDQRVDEALSRTRVRPEEIARRPRSSRAASRPGPRSRASSSPTRTCSSSTSRPTTWTSSAIEWLEEAVRRRARCAPRRLPRPGLPRRDGHPRLGAARPAPGRVPRRLLRRTPASARSGTPACAATPRPGEIEIAKEQELVQTYRSQRKHGKMHEHEARLARLDRIGTPRERAGAPPGPRPGVAAAALGRTWRCAWTTSSSAIRAAPTWRVTVRLEATRGERIGIVGPNGAGKTTLLRVIAGELSPRDGRLAFGANVQLGYLAQVRSNPLVGRDRPRRPPRRDPDDGRRGPRLPRPLPVPGRRRLQGGARAVGRRAVAARAGPPRHPAVQPAAARRADEPPRHPGPRGARGVHARNHGHAARRQPRPAPPRERPATASGSSTRAGVAPFDGGYRAWRAAVGDGWRIDEALAREEARFHGRPQAGAGGAGPRRATRAGAGDADGRARRAAAPAGSEAPPRRPRPARRASRSCRRTPTGARRRSSTTT